MLDIVPSFEVLKDRRRDNPDSEYISGEGGSVTRPQLGLLEEVTRLLGPFIHPMLISI